MFDQAKSLRELHFEQSKVPLIWCVETLEARQAYWNLLNPKALSTREDQPAQQAIVPVDLRLDHIRDEDIEWIAAGGRALLVVDGLTHALARAAQGLSSKFMGSDPVHLGVCLWLPESVNVLTDARRSLRDFAELSEQIFCDSLRLRYLGYLVSQSRDAKISTIAKLKSFLLHSDKEVAAQAESRSGMIKRLAEWQMEESHKTME